MDRGHQGHGKHFRLGWEVVVLRNAGIGAGGIEHLEHVPEGHFTGIGAGPDSFRDIHAVHDQLLILRPGAGNRVEINDRGILGCGIRGGFPKLEKDAAGGVKGIALVDKRAALQEFPVPGRSEFIRQKPPLKPE